MKQGRNKRRKKKKKKKNVIVIEDEVQPPVRARRCHPASFDKIGRAHV